VIDSEKQNGQSKKHPLRTIVHSYLVHTAIYKYLYLPSLSLALTNCFVSFVEYEKEEDEVCL
jgi:hypothetical protein